MLLTDSSCVVFSSFVLYSAIFIFAMNFLFLMLFLKATTTLFGLPAGNFVPSKISQSLGMVMLKADVSYVTLLGFMFDVCGVGVLLEKKEHPLSVIATTLIARIFDNFVIIFFR